MKIFLSVGRTFTDAQEQFVLRIEEHLRAEGLTPQTVGWFPPMSGQAPTEGVPERATSSH